MVGDSRVPYSTSRRALVACGDVGNGDMIWETERGRPLGMPSETARPSWREDECLLEEDLLDEDLDDLEEPDDLEDLLEEDGGTSRMFKMRPVVDSVTEA
jgi:hypothetical protein